MRTRAEQTAAIRADQQLWRDLAAEVGAERFSEPGAMGDWSFGDLAGHLLGWRNRSIDRLGAAARGEPEPSPPWPAELDDDDPINDWIRRRDADRPAAELVADYDDSYDRLVAALDAMPDSAMTTVYPWLGAALVDATFIGHLHDEHLADVRTWLAAPR